MIDESLIILFKGRLVWKQYIPSKRHRFGIKIFVLCDCETGLILEPIVYTGGEGHLLFTDDWYTSPQFCDYIHTHQTSSCGTVRKNRKQIPKYDKKPFDTGESELKKSGNILAIHCPS